MTESRFPAGERIDITFKMVFRKIKDSEETEIQEQIKNAIELGFDPETGEILDASALEQLQMDRDEKIENICLYIKDLMAEAAAIKTEEVSLEGRRKHTENKVKSLKNYLQAMLDGQKWKSSKAVVSYRKTQSVIVDNLDDIPNDFMRIKTTSEPDKVAIKDALKAVTEVAGCHLEEGQTMSVK